MPKKSVGGGLFSLSRIRAEFHVFFRINGHVGSVFRHFDVRGPENPIDDRFSERLDIVIRVEMPQCNPEGASLDASFAFECPGDDFLFSLGGYLEQRLGLGAEFHSEVKFVV